MKRIQISHETPVNGWLPIRFVIDGQTIDIDASNVPNNPVQDLADALDTVVRGSQAKVFWSQEPGGYFFFFSLAEDHVQLRVALAQDDDLRSREVMSVVGHRNEILLPFWRFVRNFQSHDYREPHWPAIDGRHMASIRNCLRE